ncbi:MULTISPECIES: acyltransferase family protein [Chelativorans]|uniref:acyltransferase family protein n=1 Tax=Chelativorans TaxID=449972 RepID=UPI000308F15C
MVGPAGTKGNGSGALSQERYIGADLVRIFAALLVVAFHLGFWSWANERSTPGSILQRRAEFPEVAQLTHFGWVGVEVFFMLSGFVIAFTARSSTALSFLYRRFLRLFPGAVICATITLAVALAIGWREPADLLDRYLRSASLWPYGPWIDGVYWTLGVEIAFYTLVFMLLAIGQLRRLELIMIGVGTITSLIWIVFALYHGRPSNPFRGLISSRDAQLLLLHHGMFFSVGVVIWNAIAGRFTWWRIVAVTICSIGGCVVIYPTATRDLGLELWEQASIAVWLISVLLLIAAVRFDAALSRYLGPISRQIKTGSLATYPLYLLHTVVGAAMIRVLLDAGLPRYFALAFVLIAVLLLSVAVTKWLERKLRTFLSRLLQHRAPAGEPKRDMGAPG